MCGRFTLAGTAIMRINQYGNGAVSTWEKTAIASKKQFL